MGTLSLPATGPIYVDANVAIYAVEKIEPYAYLLQPLWTKANAGELNIVTSELTWLETLTKPLCDGNTILEKIFRAFLSAREITLIPATLSIWEKASELRGLGVKTPDALHAATALESRCTMFLTNDANFQRVPGLQVTVLNDVLAS
jgi:predicted nucleic acid-binding protein